MNGGTGGGALSPGPEAAPSVIDTERASRNTGRSALTGRHPPAAREHSHLFWSKSCAAAPSFGLVYSGAQAIDERRSQ